jgi:hypothetical protein
MRPAFHGLNGEPYTTVEITYTLAWDGWAICKTKAFPTTTFCMHLHIHSLKRPSAAESVHNDGETTLPCCFTSHPNLPVSQYGCGRAGLGPGHRIGDALGKSKAAIGREH